eukprot:TRINITY_DN2872_c0_g1_i1.p1 TRINITY_DN2872_c0_g1~~TRINITY_DN2872_c0_g1_i1.p1  ORF type:complete len:310 (+),score=84.47 TRINITY_DN2872_c0_g1_i1:30-959(+)
MSLISNWDDCEKLFHHLFYNELRAAPEEHSVLVALPPGVPASQKEKLTQIMFESFNVPALGFADQAQLALFAAGRTTGVVVMVGDNSTHVVPVYEGRTLNSSFRACNSIGGRDITDYLMKLCTETGYSFTTTSERDIVADMKHKMAYVAVDFEEEMERAARSSAVEKSYELPDGQVITLGSERFRAPEILFCPAFRGSTECGMSEMVHCVISACPVQIRAELYRNIVLAGGSTLFPGIAERLTREVSALAPSMAPVCVVAPPERKYSTWIGGSIVASLSQACVHTILKEEYDQYGPAACHGIPKHNRAF